MALAVHYELAGEVRVREVPTSNANFARAAVEREAPGARIICVLAVLGRRG